jgi:hypothetical protein
VERTKEPAADVAAALDAVEEAVRTGSTDLTASGFWRVVAQVKRDPRLTEAFADRIGRIDADAFRARVKPLFPVWLGNLVLLGVVVGGAGAVAVAARTEGVIAGLALVAAAGAWSLGIHAPAHWAFGRLVGIRCVAYFFGGPPPPRPGLKTDYATYLRTPAARRAWFHASGAIATKAAPFVALALAPATAAPAWAAVIVLGLGILQIVTDAVFSVEVSDWKRFRREMAIARRR